MNAQEEQKAAAAFMAIADDATTVIAPILREQIAEWKKHHPVTPMFQAILNVCAQQAYENKPEEISNSDLFDIMVEGLRAGLTLAIERSAQGGRA